MEKKYFFVSLLLCASALKRFVPEDRMELQNVLYDVRDQIAFITVNRPKVLNALNDQTMKELKEVFLDARHRQAHQQGGLFVAAERIDPVRARADLNAAERNQRALRGDRAVGSRATAHPTAAQP